MQHAKLAIGVAGIVIIAAGAVLLLRHHSTTAGRAATKPYAIRYLPLGDSYTIGESVSEQSRWPNQLVGRLQKDGVSIGIVDNPSVTGYTTQDLIDTELPLVDTLKPNFVTILIGVNDYVQGVDAAAFQKNLQYIVNYVEARLAHPKNLILVTIPDYGKTPTGAQFGSPESSEAGIKAFNTIIAQTAAEHGLQLADVFPASQKVTTEPSLIASDGLHPSGLQYTLWTDVVYPEAKALLRPQ